MNQKDKGEFFRAWGAVGNIGIILAVSAIGGVLLGRWIDKSLGTFPLASIIGLVLGIIVGFWGIYKQVINLK